MDPLYDQIEERLAATGRRKVNPDVFEACAASLLMPIYPGLTPMPGGGDDGMDGVFGTADGLYPLITTTGADVLDNVRRNLRRFLARRYSGPRRAVVATSRALTPDQKRKIEDVGRTLKATVGPIHDRPFFVERLYRDPAWRLKLLGISGHPPALSRYPLHGRYAPPEVTVGREAELAWLRETPGDLLLVGQPGTGKTYLHQVLAGEGRCLFAVDFDQGRLADAIRAQEPAVVVVDDAHVRLNEVEALVHARHVTDARFAIHANCWPTHADDVRRRLRLGLGDVRELKRLPQRLIVELFKRMGVDGPEELLHLLLDRSDGKPGLAAALVDACKRDDYGRIWSGEAVVEHLLASAAVTRGTRARTILGVLSLGGDAGMPVDLTAQVLGMPAVGVWEETARLGLGGVIEEVGGGHLQVRPAALRPLLLLETLLSASFPIRLNDDLMRRIPSIAAATHELIGARQRSAERVDARRLATWAELSGDPAVWLHLAHADAACADLIIDEHPDRVDVAAAGLLRWAAQRAIPLLLDRDLKQSGRSTVRDAVTEWLSPQTHGEGRPSDRRATLLDGARSLLARSGPTAAATTAWALARVLSLSFHHARPVAGSPYTLNLADGVIAVQDAEQVAALWPTVHDVFRQLPLGHRKQVLAAVEIWCIPKRITHNLKSPAEYEKQLRRHGRLMLADVAGHADTPRVIRSWAARVNATGRLGLRVAVDELVDALFGRYHDRRVDWQVADEQHQAKLRRHAERLVREPVPAVAKLLADLDREVAAFGEPSSEWSRQSFFYLLATACGGPARWVDAAVGGGWAAPRLTPFLDRLAAVDAAEHDRALAELLGRPAYAQLAARRVFALASPPPTLLDTALATVEAPDNDADFSLAGPAPPVATVARLLRHGDGRVRAVAALGEWAREQPPVVRPALLADWRAAVLDVAATNYHLAEIFLSHPDVALAWCRASIGSAENGHDVYARPQGLDAARPVLTRAGRRELLDLLVGPRYADTAFDIVVGDDVTLFAGWLAGQPPGWRRLLPLRREWSPRWEQFVLAALDAGCSPEAVADHCTPMSWSIGMGEPGDRFQDQVTACQRLLAGPDRRLHPAARVYSAWAGAQATRFADRQRRMLDGE